MCLCVLPHLCDHVYLHIYICYIYLHYEKLKVKINLNELKIKDEKIQNKLMVTERERGEEG